jgi:cytochrome oxidase Cu insertion factor (SCO1/SenC/PrrC family)
MMPRPLAACLLVCVLSGVALAAAPESSEHQSSAPRSIGARTEFAAMQIIPYDSPKPAPQLALPDLDGKVARLEDFRGKVLLVFFWATW